MGLMMLWWTIIDEWLGCEGVVVVLLEYLVHMRFAWYLWNFCWNVHL